MNNRRVRLIGMAALTVFSAGLAMGSMVVENRPAPHGTRGSAAIRELLGYLYQCRDCGEVQTYGPGESAWFWPAIESSSHSARTVAAIWEATGPQGLVPVNDAGPGRGQGVARGADFELKHALAYLGGNWGSQVSERASAADEHRRGDDPPAFGRKDDSLAAVAEPAPIFLLGTVLLATFSIARLRFSR